MRHQVPSFPPILAVAPSMPAAPGEPSSITRTAVSLVGHCDAEVGSLYGNLPLCSDSFDLMFPLGEEIDLFSKDFGTFDPIANADCAAYL